MDMKRLMLTAALALVTIAPASAGDWYCLGTVKVEKEWTTIKDTSCRFKTDSKVGRKILAICPNGTECEIQMGILPPAGDVWTITKTPWRVEKYAP
jgi:hypothetical protein